MEVLIHFVFELIKIAILASIYAALLLWLFSSLGKHKPNSWFNIISKRKVLFWFISGFIISILLFGFLFSYWGDHGLGDSARIPIGHEKAVDQINASSTYITPNGYELESLDINEFATTDDFLFATISSDRPNALNKEVAIWNLRTNDVEFLVHFSDIEAFKSKENIKDNLKFKDFQKQYSSYWNGWRFWLLP